jgi:hypothetical protein
VHRWSSSAPVEEVAGVVFNEGCLRADAAATQDKAANSAKLFRGLFDALKRIEIGYVLNINFIYTVYAIFLTLRNTSLD